MFFTNLCRESTPAPADKLPPVVWRNCTLHKKLDGGLMVMSPCLGIIIETEDAVDRYVNKGESLEEDSPEEFLCLVKEDLMAFTLLGRCRHLYTEQSPLSSNKGIGNGKSKISLEEELLYKETTDGTRLDLVYIGYGMCMEGPVYARQDDSKGEIDANRFKFNLKGISLKVEPGTAAVGMGTITHSCLMVEANLTALKRIVNGELLDTVLTLPEDIDIFKSKIQNFILVLNEGFNLRPPLLHKIKQVIGISPGQRLDGHLSHSSMAHGPRNILISNHICDARLLNRESIRAGPTGFQYNVPYIKVPEYPSQLIPTLYNFSLKYRYDLLPLKPMLLAWHLWYDITHDAERQPEPYFLGGIIETR